MRLQCVYTAKVREKARKFGDRRIIGQSRLMLLNAIFIATVGCAATSSKYESHNAPNLTRQRATDPLSQYSSETTPIELEASSSRRSNDSNSNYSRDLSVAAASFEQAGSPNAKEVFSLPIVGSAGNSADVVIRPATALDTLTLEQLEQLALANNPTIQQAQAIIEKARGIREQVGYAPNPTVGYFAGEMGDEGTAGKQGAFLSQTIVTGGKLAQNRVVANQELRYQQFRLNAQEYRVRNAVRSQFFETLGAQQRVEIANELVLLAEQGVDVSQQLLDALQKSRADLLQARIQLNETQILLRNAEYEYEAAWTQLANLIGDPTLRLSTLAGDLDAASTEVHDMDLMLEDLLASSPEMHAAQAQIDAAASQVQRQIIQPIPNFVGQFNVAHDNANGDNIASVQLGVPLPIFNANEGGIYLSQAEYRRAVSNLRRTELEIRNRWASITRSYRQAQNQVQQYESAILPAAQESVELTQEGYRQGEYDLIRALAARQTYFQASLASVESKVALRQAEVALTGFVLSGGLEDAGDTSGGNLGGIGMRSEALSGQ